MMTETCSAAPTLQRVQTRRPQMRIADVDSRELQAVEEWARAGAGKLLRVANLYLRNEREAEQVVRDVMLSALRAESEGDAEAAGDAWLRRQTLTLALRKLRNRPHEDEPSIDHLMPRFRADGSRADAAGLPGPSDDEEIVAAVRRHMERLPELHRAVYLLKTVEGLDLPSIADHLDLSETRTRRLLHEARLALCTLLARPRRGRPRRVHRR